MEWKEIDENYLVSSDGQIYSKYKHRKLKAQMKKGYPCIDLSACGKSRRIPIHRLVAMAFIPNPEGYPEVNHRDGIKMNNSVDNLEWCTSEMNNSHAMATGLTLYGMNVPHSKMTDYSVSQARFLYATTTLGYKKLAELYGVDRNTIREIINGKAWRHI